MDASTTVVLLTYNCAHRIARILDRLEALGVPIIAVDNGSSDGTAALLHARTGIDVVALPKNIGAAGRNEGARRAHTPYVAFCDDDGWYERDGLVTASTLLDRYPRLAVVNARILVGPDNYLDPISGEMAESPIPERDGVPGIPILGFMGGASIMRVSAFLGVGGYDERYFMGGEEETVAVPLAMAGWALRYVPEVVMHHEPSLANATRFRALGMRNTIVTAWLHRSIRHAARWTLFTLADQPKNGDYLRGIGLVIRAVPWVIRERQPMGRQLDSDLAQLNRRRFAERRPFFTFRAWRPESAG